MPEIKVRIKDSNGRLQLVYSYQGNREYLSLGLSATAVNQRLAELKAAEIEQDFLYDRYKGKAHYAPGLQITTPVNQGKLELMDLWERYFAYKTPQLRPSGVRGQATCTNLIKRCPFEPDEAIKIHKWLVSVTTPYTVKATIGHLRRMSDWAVNEGLISNNNYLDLKLPKSKSTKVYRKGEGGEWFIAPLIDRGGRDIKPLCQGLTLYDCPFCDCFSWHRLRLVCS
jgi:hypothetical protein